MIIGLSFLKKGEKGPSAEFAVNFEAKGIDALSRNVSKGR